MKKIFRLMLAAAVMASVVSCAKEQVSDVQVGQEVEVTFAADLGGALGSRAIADGTTVDEVAWAIYEDGATKPLDSLQGTLVLVDKKATLNVRLVTGKTYDVAFFAYKANAAAEDGVVDPKHYTVAWDEQTVTMDTTNTAANDEERDCFWYVEHDLYIDGPINKTFTLTRPLAQLNLGVAAEDVKNAAKAGYSVSASEIVVDTYATFNLFDGKVSDPIQKAVKFVKNASPVAATAPEVLKVKDDATDYNYLATTYILVNEKITSEVSVTLWDQDDKEFNTLKYSYVPFQRNYRTNILGNLLTNPAVFTIVVDERFNEPDNIIKHWDGTATAVAPDANGNYVIKNAAELAYIAQIVNGGDNLEGKTVTLADNIDMNGNTWVPIGKSSAPFAGTFEGAGYSVSNFVVKAEECAGLFGRVFKKGAAASINNVKVHNATIEGSHWAGGVVAHIYGNVTNCEADGVTIVLTPNAVGSGYDNGDKAGGIAGYVGENGYQITGNKVNNVSITAYRDLGGVVGMLNGTSVASNNEGANVTLVCDQITNNYGAETPNAGAVVGRKGGNVVMENNNVQATIEYKGAAVAPAYDEATKTYSVSNDAELIWISRNAASLPKKAVIALTADIDLAGENWESIKACNPEWPVTFDGQNHTISNINAPLFNSSTASIKNVVVDGANIEANSNFVGVVAGNLYGNLENVTVKNATLVADDTKTIIRWGGIVGIHNSGNATNCVAENVNISGVYHNAGGICGTVNETSNRVYTNCKAVNCNVSIRCTSGSGVSMVAALVGNANGVSLKLVGCSQENCTPAVLCGTGNYTIE